MQSGYVKLMQRMLNDKKDLYTYNNIDEEFPFFINSPDWSKTFMIFKIEFYVFLIHPLFSFWIYDWENTFFVIF